MTKAQDQGTGDPSQVVKRLKCTALTIHRVVAEWAYCTKTRFKTAYEKGIEQVTIPPRTQHVHMNEDPAYVKMNAGIVYLQDLEVSRTQRRAQWKQEHDYGIRSRIESAMIRLKQRLGRYFSLKTDQRRYREMVIKVNLMNTMQRFGLPKSLKYTP